MVEAATRVTKAAKKSVDESMKDLKTELADTTTKVESLESTLLEMF